MLPSIIESSDKLVGPHSSCTNSRYTYIQCYELTADLDSDTNGVSGSKSACSMSICRTEMSLAARDKSVGTSRDGEVADQTDRDEYEIGM